MCINTSVDDALNLIMKQCNFITKYHHSKIGEHNFTAIQWTNIPRTSDSLDEGLPIKMTREEFQRKRYFLYEKDSRFNPRLIHKSRFLIGQVPIAKYGLKTLFLLFNI